MKKLLLAALLVPTIALAAPGEKAFLPTASQAALALGNDNESKMLIFGYVTGIVQGLQVGKAICTPAGKTATQFNEEIVDVIIEGLIDPSIPKGKSLLVADISTVLQQRFPCSTRPTM